MEDKQNYTIDDFTKARKKAQRKEWVQNKLHNVGKWIDGNKELIILVGPTVISAATAGIKWAGKHVTLRKEQDLKDLYCYDRSLGHYWRLRRELSNAEWVEIDRRKNNGERLGDILAELKVLK